MDFRKRLLTVFGALTLAVGVFGVPAQAAKARCTSEECACEQALRQNTVEALEKFLKKYPQSTASGGTACAALAVPPAEEGSTGQSTDDAQAPLKDDSSQYGG
jgi:hypothetical protein